MKSGGTLKIDFGTLYLILRGRVLSLRQDEEENKPKRDLGQGVMCGGMTS